MTLDKHTNNIDKIYDDLYCDRLHLPQTAEFFRRLMLIGTIRSNLVQANY
ncbi:MULTISPECIES: hypothetical protein [Fischerella]|nr:MULTISPECIES: hypothetical protein [Fischerella]